MIWRIIHATGRNRTPGFNLTVDRGMSLSWAVILMTFWTGIAACAGTIQQQSDSSPVPNAVRQESLENRVSSASESLLKRFSNELNMNVSAHTVTPGERITLVNALAQLTPFQREVLHKRLHAIYFMDGLPGNALTFPDGGPTAEPMYSIAVRAGALHETVSELVTRKERTLFDSAGSELSVTIDGELSMQWSMCYCTRQPILWILRWEQRLIPHIQGGIIHW